MKRQRSGMWVLALLGMVSFLMTTSRTQAAETIVPVKITGGHDIGKK